MPGPARGHRGVVVLIDEIRRALAALLGDGVEQIVPIGGGDLNDAFRARLAGGDQVFVKARAGADPEEYRVEAASLEWLGGAGGVRVPAVLGAGEGEGDGAPPFLALEWIEAGRLSPSGAEDLGRGLAMTHRAGAARFGSRPDGAEGSRLHIGPLALGDQEMERWLEFYAEFRLAPVARVARDRGALTPGGAELVERVCERIADLAGPPEPPARLHGDLWSGNVMADATGQAVLIDAAAYGGHREVDLAMLRLFGAPDERVFGAYEEEWPLADGWRKRIALWQLFPMLVHTALFGGGYGARAAELARRLV